MRARVRRAATRRSETLAPPPPPQIVFNNSLLGPVPEEGVSRLVTQQVGNDAQHHPNACPLDSLEQLDGV